jgi:hypothetical protein
VPVAITLTPISTPIRDNTPAGTLLATATVTRTRRPQR